MEEEEVVLVDVHDNDVGTAPKLQAHLRGQLHRAVSVFVFDDRGRMLLQRRAAGKYHSAGLWSNACCTHPRPGESPQRAAARRLLEEMGLALSLEPAFVFIYRAALDAGLTEHELDHVFVAQGSGTPLPDPAEVCDWRWEETEEISRELGRHPERFTAWFPLAFERVISARAGGNPGGAT